MLRRQCKHKRAGDPRRPCRRCYRVGVRRYAETTVRDYAAAVRTVADVVGVQLVRRSSR